MQGIAALPRQVAFCFSTRLNKTPKIPIGSRFSEQEFTLLKQSLHWRP
jgi:hypothetical protein